MWRPGTKKPNGTVMVASQSPAPSSTKDSSSRDSKDKTPSSTRKRLSGATMNMKFMKRKKEMIQNAEKRNAIFRASTKTTESSGTGESHQETLPQNRNMLVQQGSVAMDVEPCNQLQNREDRFLNNIDELKSHHFAQATAIDMYGIEAAIIGRRSFGGFNPAMERAYRDCRSSVESGGTLSNLQQKVSDEKLLQRYQEIAKHKHAGASRPVGNLDSKIKKRTRKGLR